MRAMMIERLGPVREGAEPLVLVDRPEPQPGPGEVLIRVSACGVCHTELDEIEGRTAPRGCRSIPGHQVVGRVAALGPGWALSRGRAGGGGLDLRRRRHLPSCRRGDENLCPRFVRHRPRRRRRLRRAWWRRPSSCTRCPMASPTRRRRRSCARARSGTGPAPHQPAGRERLGLTGFGASAHLVLQLARHQFPRAPVFVFARHEAERAFARELGAAWAGDTRRAPRAAGRHHRHHPAWTPVVARLGNLDRGGRLVINAIRKEEGDKATLLGLDYARTCGSERSVKSVANVSRRGRSRLLRLAAAIPLRPEIEGVRPRGRQPGPGRSAGPRIRGAKVLRVS
jgi:propanol-preferring alcohol dehydrogenase